MILRFKGERVAVDTSGWDVGVMLVWLDEIEITSIALGETIMSVKLEFGI